MSGFHNSPEGERFALREHIRIGLMSAGVHLLIAGGMVWWHCYLAYKDHKRNLERLEKRHS